MKINIIGADNGVGLTQDANILQELFEREGHEVNFFEFWAMKRILPPKADVNIFLELFDKRLCNADRNYLIPNQEWFLPKWFADLPALNAVLCKTKHAVNIFNPHAKTEYISFTSRDCSTDGHKRRDFVHLRGRSKTKGTLALLHAYRDNPTLQPVLIHMTRPFTNEEKAYIKKHKLGNLRKVTYSTQRIPAKSYTSLISNSIFHICPSPAEGFGHYINEPMSAGNIVITTDAPPMNELVTPDCGLLFGYKSKQQHYGGFWFEPDSKALAEAINCASQFTHAKILRFERNARQAYFERDSFFRKRIKEIIV